MDSKNIVQFCILEEASSVEDFLKSTFQCSSNKLKKYFDKSFLARSLKSRSLLNLPLNFVNDGRINPQYKGPQIDIVFEDEFFLVLNKPPGIFVHPHTYCEQDNCLSFLRTSRAEVLLINEKSYDRGLLYRLDLETSGVLIYVKNESAYHFLRENFKTIARKKIYLCLVEGKCELNGHYQHFFSAKEVKGKRVVVSEGPTSGDKGELSVKVLSYDLEKNVSLVEVELYSGLRHQIRAQLSFLGHPLRGDTFYGGQQANRLYLHAFNYQLNYLNQSYDFKIPPQDFSGL